MKKIFKQNELDFILNNWTEISQRGMARRFKVSPTVMKRIYKENRLVITQELKEKFRREGLRQVTTSTPEIDKFLKENYLTIPEKRLGKQLKKSGSFVRTRLRQLNLVIPEHIIEERIKDSQFDKGHVPFNKGKKITDFMTPEAIANSKVHRYKKGNTPHNTASKDGVIRVRNSSEKNRNTPYKYIRISKGHWELYHRVLWEKEHGPIPDGMCVWFKDDNTLNCVIENLELVTRAEILNRNYLQYPEELKQSMKKLNKIKKLIKEKSSWQN